MSVAAVTERRKVAPAIRGLRRVAPLDLPAIPKATELGAKPKLQWIAPTALLVDETYQRDLSRNSLALIKKLVRTFAWNRMKPPVVVEVRGGFHIVDGQHTAIAAATVGVAEIPVFVVEAVDVAARANAFVAHNRDRVAISSIDLFNALVSAGDPDALDVAAVCKRAGVRIRTLNQSTQTAEGDSMAVMRIRTLVGRRGVLRARQVLEALVKARRAPISQSEIMAAEHAMCVERKQTTIDELAAAVRITGNEGLRRARAEAQKNRVPHWRVLAGAYLAHLGGAPA